MPYPTPAMQGATSSVLAETLTQVSPQMASHAGLNTAQAGGMSKVSERQCFAAVPLTRGTFLSSSRCSSCPSFSKGLDLAFHVLLPSIQIPAVSLR